MDLPSDWEMFQTVLIGTIAGVISSGITNRGTAYIMVLSFGLWIFLIVSLRIAKPVFEWIENKKSNDDTEERPYQDVEYAS